MPAGDITPARPAAPKPSPKHPGCQHRRRALVMSFGARARAAVTHALPAVSWPPKQTEKLRKRDITGRSGRRQSATPFHSRGLRRCIPALKVPPTRARLRRRRVFVLIVSTVCRSAPEGPASPIQQ